MNSTIMNTSAMRRICAACGLPDGADVATEVCAKCSKELVTPTVFDCARLGLLPELKLLIENNAAFDVNALEESTNATILHHAAINNKIKLLEYIFQHEMLSKEVDIERLGGELQTTPMFWAAYHNHIYVVELLLQHGANMHFRDRVGFNSYLLAIHRCFPILAAYLVAKGMDVNCRVNDDTKRTALMILCQRQQFHLDSMRMLLALRPDINATDAKGNTALHYAVRNDVGPAVRMLLDHGADPEIKNEDGLMPVDLAQRLAKKSLAKLLIVEDNELRQLSKKWGISVDWLQENLYKGAFLVPWVVIPAVPYILSKSSDFKVTSGLIIAVVAAAFMAVKFLQKGAYGDKKKAAPLLFGLNVASIAFLCIVIPYHGLQYCSLPFKLILLVSVCLLLFFLYTTAVTDPGVFGTTYAQKLHNIQALVEVKSRVATKLCLTCLHRRPLRSKHCAELNVCIARFDHYCPFVVNAIGAENHHHFFGFLFFAVSSIGMGLGTLWQYIYHQDDLLWAEGFLWLVHSIAYLHPVAACAALLSVAHICWIGYLLLMHGFLVLEALTTNELMKNENKSRSFSRGPFWNIIDFFRLPGHLRVDWTQINRVEDFLEETKKNK